MEFFCVLMGAAMFLFCLAMAGQSAASGETKSHNIVVRRNGVEKRYRVDKHGEVFEIP